MPGRVVCYDDTGREVVSWMVHGDAVTLDEMPVESDNAVREASLVVAEVDGMKTVLKYRYGPLSTDADTALARVRHRDERV